MGPPDGQDAVAPPAPTAESIPGWFYRIVYRGIQAGLCPLIPIPFVDDWAESKVRGWMVLDLLEERGWSASEEEIRILAGNERGGRISGFVLGVAVKPLKWVFRKTFIVLSIRAGVHRVSEVFHQGYLLRYALDGEPLSVERARRIHAAIRKTQSEQDPGPISQIVQRAFVGSTGLLKDAAGLLGRMIPRRRTPTTDAPEPELDREERKLLSGMLDGIVDSVWYQQEYLEALTTRFDANLVEAAEGSP